jgi:radical SAM protein with 4Fe4S-binding SPASM domain
MIQAPLRRELDLEWTRRQLMPASTLGQLHPAEDLIMLEGEEGDLVIGNGCDFHILYVRKGARLKSLLNDPDRKALEAEPGLFDLLVESRILMDQRPARGDPPPGTRLCGAVSGEFTLCLPLTTDIPDDVWSNALRYSVDSLANGANLNLQFYGADPLTVWPVVETLAGKLEQACSASEHPIHLKYHLETEMRHLSSASVRWFRKHRTVLTVYLPLAGGLRNVPRRTQEVVHNIQSVSDSCSRCQVVVPVRASNVHQLPEIAQYLLGVCNCHEFDFPALPHPEYRWDDDWQRHAPDPGQLVEGWLNTYDAAGIDLIHFRPAREIFSRISAGGYAPACACHYNCATALKQDGSLFPCGQALHAGEMCTGNVRTNPEGRNDAAWHEWRNVWRRAWEICHECSWRYLCGMTCPVWSTVAQEGTAYVDRLRRYYCTPRIELAKRIIWDIVGESCSLSSPQTA